jgi:chromosome partitioning protein
MNGHMRTVAISINKGGVGKTTLTKSLAVQAVEAGFNVLILDLDSQQNAADWGKRRVTLNKPLPLTRFATEKDLESELQRAAKAGCDVVFIDTPPGRSSEAMAAVELADLVLIPFENDQDAYTGVTKTAQLARRLGKEAYGVLNKAPPNSHAHEDTAREVLKAINLPLAPVALHRYDAYRLANVQGMAVQEFDPSSTPALQIEGLWNWLSALLQVSTSAPVHKKGAA